MQGDCLLLLNELPPSSVDLIIGDLPYGTTNCQWDCKLNLDVLWPLFFRVVKENGVILSVFAMSGFG